MRIFIQWLLKSISYDLGCCFSWVRRPPGSASNAGRQIWMKIIYIVLHSLNSICKTSLVDMKLPVSVVLEWWSSIGRNLATVLRSITVFWYLPTLPEIIIFCFFTMLHVSGSFFMVEPEYLEANVILCHTLVTNGMRLIRVAKGGFLSHLTLTFLKPSPITQMWWNYCRKFSGQYLNPLNNRPRL